MEYICLEFLNLYLLLVSIMFTISLVQFCIGYFITLSPVIIFPKPLQVLIWGCNVYYNLMYDQISCRFGGPSYEFVTFSSLCTLSRPKAKYKSMSKTCQCYELRKLHNVTKHHRHWLVKWLSKDINISHFFRFGNVWVNSCGYNCQEDVLHDNNEE